MDPWRTRDMALGPLAHPKLIEVVGMTGDLHGVWIDQEHMAISHQQLEVLMLACRAAGLDAFARVPPLDYTTIMRPMEAGAGGVMVAQIRSVDQVREIVAWAKYPPVGLRGMYLGNYEAGYGTMAPSDLADEANTKRWLAIQIETVEAVEGVDEIAAVDGVDTLFVGPGDLAVALGVPGEALHAKCIAALESVSAAAKSAGKSWGILTRSPEHAAKCRELGCQLFSLVGDMEIIHRGLQSTKQLYSDFF